MSSLLFSQPLNLLNYCLISIRKWGGGSYMDLPMMIALYCFVWCCRHNELYEKVIFSTTHIYSGASSRLVILYKIMMQLCFTTDFVEETVSSRLRCLDVNHSRHSSSRCNILTCTQVRCRI